jgi:CBS domain-containing protein
MRDVMRLQSYDTQLIAADIAKAHSIEELCLVRDDIDRFMQRLYIADVDGRTLAEVLTDLNDTVVRRVMAMNEAELRAVGHTAPVCRFAWVAFGSEGRRAQMLRGDQDNGIIIEDTGATPKVLDYYRRLAGEVNEDLATYGFDLCPGGVMAREDPYFGTETEWRRRVATAVHNVHEGTQGRYLSIVLDARPVAGDGRLVRDLWEHMLWEIDRHPPALLALARDATTKTVPLTLLGRLRYEDAGDGRRGINLKRYGMLSLLSAIKALCVQQGIAATETVSRIQALGRAGALDDDTVEKLVAAYELFMRLRFQSSIEAVFDGRDSSLMVFPDEWTEWGREDLKRTFKAVDKLLDTIRSRFPVPS